MLKQVAEVRRKLSEDYGLKLSHDAEVLARLHYLNGIDASTSAFLVASAIQADAA